MVLACVVDGESFAVIEEDSDGVQVRLIPAEMVEESKTADLGQGRYIAAGIEFDARGRRVAYHIQPQRPTDLFPTSRTPIRVPCKGRAAPYASAGAGAGSRRVVAGPYPANSERTGPATGRPIGRRKDCRDARGLCDR